MNIDQLKTEKLSGWYFRLGSNIPNVFLILFDSETGPSALNQDMASKMPEQRTYGFNLSVVKNKKSFDVVSSYSTHGPRDEKFEENPSYKKLNDFFKFLESLRHSDGVSMIQMSAEEREAESFFNRNGYKKNERPKFVSSMTYYQQMKTLNKRKLVQDRTPFTFQYGGGDRFFVVHIDATSIKRIEYQG